MTLFLFFKGWKVCQITKPVLDFNLLHSHSFSQDLTEISRTAVTNMKSHNSQVGLGFALASLWSRIQKRVGRTLCLRHGRRFRNHLRVSTGDFFPPQSVSEFRDFDIVHASSSSNPFLFLVCEPQKKNSATDVSKFPNLFALDSL